MATTGPVVHVFSWVKGLAANLRSKCPSLQVKEIKIPPRFVSSKQQLEEESLKDLREAEVLVVCSQSVEAFDVLYEIKNVKWVMSAWAGVDGIMKRIDPVKGPPDFTLTRFAGVAGPHITEYVIGHIIGHERKFSETMTAQKENRWAGEDVRYYRRLSNLTLGIVGYGDIGFHIAKAAKFFGMKVYGMGRRETISGEKAEAIDKYIPITRLSEMLAECDYVCNILPSTQETKGLFNGETLKPCQAKKSVFINVGRGDVVSPESVIRAVDEGWLEHAILDVYEVEPLPETSPLWKHPSITLTPHIACTSFSDEVADVFLDNYARFVKGEPLKFVVDWKSEY